MNIFRSKTPETIKTHIFCSLQAFVRLELMRSENIISNRPQSSRPSTPRLPRTSGTRING